MYFKTSEPITMLIFNTKTITKLLKSYGKLRIVRNLVSDCYSTRLARVVTELRYICINYIIYIYIYTGGTRVQCVGLLSLIESCEKNRNSVTSIFYRYKLIINHTVARFRFFRKVRNLTISTRNLSVSENHYSKGAKLCI